MPDSILDILRGRFGLDAFREPQETIVRHVVQGGSALVLMPTGGGKSLCFQLPALVRPGLALVVSPLIALMEDQVRGLQDRGIAATCVHSLLEPDERKRRIAAARRGELDLLYLTPERFRVPGFFEQLAGVPIALFAVDEAHCLSQWGHDFRPDYGRLGEVRKRLGAPPTVAVTATATPRVQDDIRRVLGLQDAPLFHTGLARENLALSTELTEDFDAKLARTLEVIRRVGGPGIVYCALIKDLLVLEDALQAAGYRPIVYHGKLSTQERMQAQAAFMASEDGLVLATNAFGMGVDKAQVRFIIHHQMTRTLEAYVQEVGRAGRDGQPAFCELHLAEEDLAIQRSFLEWANPELDFLRSVVQQLSTLGERLRTMDEEDLTSLLLLKNRGDGRVRTCLNLLETAGACRGELGHDFEWLRTPEEEELAAWLPAEKREEDLQGLLAMLRFGQGTRCLRETIHEWFGVPFEGARATDSEAGAGAESGCGGCSVCVGASELLSSVGQPGREIPRRDRQASGAPSEASAPTASAGPQADEAPAEGESAPELTRGDWIDVDGMGPARVLKVAVERKRTLVEVEVVSSLQKRRFPLGKRRWRRLQ